MKKIYSLLLIGICLYGILNFVNYNKYYSPNSTVMPVNAMDTGKIIPASLFSTWLPTGVTPVQNVFVKPANGLTFNDFDPNPVPLHFSNPANAFINLNFYRWTEQMFLWLLSPASGGGTSYSGCGGFVFNSAEFFDVSATDPITGLRTLKRHTCSSNNLPISTSSSRGVNTSMTFDIKGAANGENNLPVLFEKDTRKIYDIDKALTDDKGNKIVLDMNNKKRGVKYVKVINKEPIFYDMNNNIIQKPHFIYSQKLNESSTVQKFITDKKQEIFIVRGVGGVMIIIVPDQGQSTGDVLMAKNGSLIYYNTMVNDVYAVFLTMIKNGILPDTTRFPTTQAELDEIVNYAALKNIPIVEPNSLAMELKTSWIETTNLPNPTDYVTVNATIPKYIQTSSSQWTRSGTKTTTLALVGMHIVGSVAGHPEMIWGSVEHINNTPNRQYNYRNSSNGVTSVVADTNFGTGTAWLFSSATATSFNVSHMMMGGATGTDISALSSFTISGSDTQRTKPFAFGTSVVGLSEDRSNAQIIAGNNDVNARLVGNDIRKNYFHIGSTWNISEINFAHVGTNQLSNSTMETYSQFQNVNSDPRTNCFGCHTANNSSNLSPQLSFISHVFNSSPI
ncbi:MAG: hypothetical protein EOO47_24225, partial [Flavobacterium sp.]